jgi:hypothetical protein
VDQSVVWSITAALTPTGAIVCWGFNRYGQCEVPVGLQNVIEVAWGFDVATEGAVECRVRHQSQFDVPIGVDNVVTSVAEITLLL